jgi:very-short-patch-repair endonuclease
MPTRTQEDRTIVAHGGRGTSAARDRAVAALADRQHGVVARRQLLELGLTPKMVRRRVETARLVVLHLGVYAVGHARLTRHGEWLAGVLAVGPDAVLSHRSAAALHGVRQERGRRVDVATTAKRASTNWIEVHGRQTLAPADVTVRDGIPVTTVSRTLVDLASILDARDLSRTVNEADVLRVFDLGELSAALERARGRRGGGAAALGAAIERHAGPVVLRSELERLFHELLRDRALPPALHNERVGRWEVDACWPGPRVAVELDSARFHRTPPSRRRDRAKERDLIAAGWQVRRYRFVDVGPRAAATVAELRELLA